MGTAASLWVFGPERRPVPVEATQQPLFVRVMSRMVIVTVRRRRPDLAERQSSLKQQFLNSSDRSVCIDQIVPVVDQKSLVGGRSNPQIEPRIAFEKAAEFLQKEFDIIERDRGALIAPFLAQSRCMDDRENCEGFRQLSRQRDQKTAMPAGPPPPQTSHPGRFRY